MNHLLAFTNTLTASTITLLLARLFGHRRVVTDELGTLILYRWREVDYVFNFKLNPHCYQCDAAVSYLFADGRCGDCTRIEVNNA
jgi:hypothetical protein